MIDKKQANHFNEISHRYNEDFLVDPPKHTKTEIGNIITEIEKRKIDSVIDFGCGNGRLSIPLLMQGIHVTAVDVSNNSLKALSNKVSQINSIKNLLKTSQVLPDVLSKAIVGCDILHHVDLDVYLSKIRNTLAPKGAIIFSEPNILNIAWSLLITFTIDWRIEWRIIYCNYFTLLKKLRDNKYKNIKIKGVGLIPPALFNTSSTLQKINYVLGDMFFLKLFAYRFLIIAEKG